MNEYDNIIQQDQAEALRGAMFAASRAQPDQEAALQKLSERTGVPLEAVRIRRQDVEIQDKLNSFDYEKAIKENPKLSAWMADPKNAALASDDWDSLSAIDKLFRYGKDYTGALGGSLVGDAFGRTLSGAGELLNVGARTAGRVARPVLGDKLVDPMWDKSPTVFGYSINPVKALADSLKATGGSLKAVGDWMKPVQERQTLGTDVAGGVGQIGGQIATFLLTGGLATTATMFAQGADIMEEKTAQDIADPALRDTSILAGGAITAITERYGLSKLLNRVPPEVKNRTLRFLADKVAAGGIEAGQEFAEGLLHDIARKTLTNKDAELLTGVGREMSAAALSAAIVRGALGVRGHARAQEQQQFVQALAQTAEGSKLRERMPERFKAYLDSITAGGPVENIFIPAERFATYFQEAGIDPAVMASGLGAQNFDEAVLAGTDIVIPTSEFITQLSGSDHLQGLWNDLRFNQGDMTLAEAAQFGRDQDAQEIDDETLKAMTGVDTARPGFAAVKDQIMGELAGRFDMSTAESYATQYAAVISTLAERAGMDPLALADRYGLSVNMPMPDRLKKLLERERVDIDMDPLLDRLRAGDIPKTQHALGQSLYEFVRDAGGLKDSAEARNMDENIRRLPGQKKIVQPNGMSADAALQYAIEAGYFPGRTDLFETDLLEAMFEDISGNRIYAPYNGNDALADEYRMLTETAEWLDGIGVDLKTMTNAEVRARIQAVSAQDAAEVYDQADNADKRANITIGANRKMTISLFEKANLSSFLHETGHFYLEVMGDLAESDTAPRQLKDDYATILQWMGVGSRAEIKTEQHEMFARANEAYLMEGKSPSPELQGAFQRFRAWLMQIYKTVAALNVTLSDEVRGVFDRMYATDEQIDAAQSEADFVAMFATATEAGMTDAEFEAYRASVGQTIEQGRERLQTRLMNELQREKTKMWRQERERMREAVMAEVDATPVYSAFKALVDGQTADGIAVKLSREDFIRQYSKEFLKSLPRGFQRIYAAEGGVDIDTAAEVLGFDSGRAMVEALVNMKPRLAMIEQLTDERMKDFFGDMRLDGTIAEEAMQALHNDRREDVLKIEFRALLRAIRQKGRDDAAADRAAKREGEQMVRDSLPQREQISRTKRGKEFTFQAFDPEPMKRAAAGIIGQKNYRDLNPQGYLIAERKAGRAGAKAAKAGDYQEAAGHKQRELLNHYLYKEAVRVKKEVERKSSWLADQGKSKKRQALGKAGADYLEQVDGILERYEFRRVAVGQLARRESLAAWVNAQEALGHAVAVPEDVLNEARRVNWTQIPVDELRAVYDSVKNIAHLSSLKNELLVKGQRRDFEEVKKELLDSTYANQLQSTGELDQPNMAGASLREKGAALWKRFDAAHIKIEQLVAWLDGGNIDGPWARHFFDLADGAQTAEYDLHRRVTLALNELRMAMPKDWQASLFDRAGFDLPIGRAGAMVKPTRYTLLSIALNMGNEQNMQRLRDGNKLSDAMLQKVRGSLTDTDLKFVQGVWDAVETLWPDMAALEKRASGLEPEKVEAASFGVRGVTYRGGYFPLVYDSRASGIGEKQIEGDRSVESFLSSGFGRPSTNKGATKKRMEVVNQPVLLDMNEVLGGHIAKVVKDISHREAVMGLHKILTDSKIKEALIDRLGEAYYREMRDWTKVLVNDRSDSMNAAKGMAKAAMVARTNLSIVTMGWKIGTMMSQFAGFGPSADLVRPAYLGRALMQAARAPRETWALVSGKSGEMRNRSQTIDRDVRDAMRRIADKRSVVADIQRTAFILTSMADRIVSVPTWLGAYTQATAEGLDEEAAIRAGDRAVRLSQGAGGAKDLAAVQRNNELMKLMTMYYTPFSALYSRLRDIGHRQAIEGVGYLPSAIARTIALVALPAVMGEILAGRSPDEDEDEVWWAVRRMLLYPIVTLPGIRDFSGLIEEKMISLSDEGEMEFKPGYNVSPVVSAIGKAWNNLISRPIDIAAGEDEFDSDAAWGAFESAGLVVGLPTAQVHITGSYLTDLISGEADPESAPELLRNLLFRRKRE